VNVEDPITIAQFKINPGGRHSLLKFINILIFIEILLINLYTFVTFSKKRVSASLVWLSLAFFSGFFLLVISPILQNLPNLKYDHGLILVAGFVYIIPLHFLHDQHLRRTMLIMGVASIYTTLVYVLSFRLSYVLSAAWLPTSTLVIQTLIFLFTFKLFLNLVEGKFLKILKYLEKRALNRLLVISILWFLLILLVNYTFIEEITASIEVLIFVLILSNVFFSYQLFQTLVSINQKTITLTEKKKLDTLTNLKTRESLYTDVGRKIEKGQPFYLIFLDLDNFKWVNDTFGHAAGDAYLIQFTQQTQQLLKETDYFYRMSGDEFILVYDGKDIAAFCEMVEGFAFQTKDLGIPFQGLSIGVSHCPSDALQISNLLRIADEKMYQVKKEKHRTGYTLGNIR